MERQVLEEEVLKRLNIKRPCDIPMYKAALKKKTTQELEKLLQRMKEAGRL